MPPKRKRVDDQPASSPTAASTSSPAADSASSPAPTGKQAKLRRKKQKLQQEVQPDDATYPFFNSRDLNDIQPLPTHEWTPATDEEIDNAVKNITKYSEDAKRARVRGTNYDIQNVKSLGVNLNWWDWDWKYQEPPKRDPNDGGSPHVERYSLAIAA
ncbi:hypothetical protein PG985_016347 [Apiospora marii]|uniref:uncharacterized protein n=1 Tax=Apiospora marii TaxID=335849 RepID=UPI00312FE235